MTLEVFLDGLIDVSGPLTRLTVHHKGLRNVCFCILQTPYVAWIKLIVFSLSFCIAFCVMEGGGAGMMIHGKVIVQNIRSQCMCTPNRMIN